MPKTTSGSSESLLLILSCTVRVASTCFPTDFFRQTTGEREQNRVCELLSKGPFLQDLDLPLYKTVSRLLPWKLASLAFLGLICQNTYWFPRKKPHLGSRKDVVLAGLAMLDIDWRRYLAIQETGTITLGVWKAICSRSATFWLLILYLTNDSQKPLNTATDRDLNLTIEIDKHISRAGRRGSVQTVFMLFFKISLAELILWQGMRRGKTKWARMAYMSMNRIACRTFITSPEWDWIRYLGGRTLYSFDIKTQDTCHNNGHSFENEVSITVRKAYSTTLSVSAMDVKIGALHAQRDTVLQQISSENDTKTFSI